MPEPSAPAQTKQLPKDSVEDEEKTEVSGAEAKAAAAETARAAAFMKARKRTKTGCLTCRKRRIKCGEERPTCKNCVKSKRECEGYIPRVIFKDPLGAFQRGQPGIAVRASHNSGHNEATGLYGTIQSTPLETPIAPRLPAYTEQAGFGHGAVGDYYSTTGYTSNGGPFSAGTDPLSQRYIARRSYSSGEFQSVLNAGGLPQPQVKPVSYPAFDRQVTGESDSAIEMSYNDRPSHWAHGSEPSTAHSAEFPPMFARNPTMPFPIHVPSNSSWSESPEIQKQVTRPTLSSNTHQSYPSLPEGTVQDTVKHQIIKSHNQSYGPPAYTPWTNEPEEEYFDVDSEDEDYGMQPAARGPLSYNIGPLIAMSANHSNGGTRSMTNFLNEPNVLATYRPSYAASPLMDPPTARIFCHFITATAPTLAVCERHPSNPSVIFSGYPAPKSQRALWSYTLPMLALTHQGLLHAMLALASLHISKLQRSSPTPSLKHYHYALRRVAKALGNQKKRKDVATLAATLLLGFYEVTTAEHNKWNSHLSGARELVMDIDFAGMAKKIENHRCRQEEAEANSNYQMLHGYSNGYQQSYLPRVSEDFPAREDRQLNENLISALMGWRLKYNQYGQVIDENDPPASDQPPTAQDIENFEIQCDLFWWYAKQDMYQSIISGNRLLLSYDRWCLCPPRAPVGRLDAVFGSLDHLLLLMGRLADFAGKDLPRKLRAQREAEKTLQSQAAGQHTNQPSPPQRPPTMPNSMQARPMYGMVPDPGPVRVPTGFDQAQHDRIYTAPVPSEDKSLDIATHEAECQWAAISQAFDVYLESLGPAYAPLEPEHMPPMATPFGPALYYRSYAIACILTMYFCGRIICMRVKPTMPPAAMAAAGVAAQSTATYANTIGRIVAGIQPVDNTIAITPSHGAALMDVCMGLFHAGVQYRDAAQRGWTISKLRDTARLTGWQTSNLIASGCERAWIRAAEMGRGPPYSAPMDHADKDDRVAGRGRDPRDLEQPAKDNNDRRFITVNAGTRVYWALGILGIEEDLKGMKLD